MTALVQVALKRTVLDPQGTAIQAALGKLGYTGIAGLRQGKVFEIEFAPEVDRAAAENQAERAARDVLTNPVIEEYSIHWAK